MHQALAGHILKMVLGYITSYRPRYVVTSSLIGWAHTQNGPWVYRIISGVLSQSAYVSPNHIKCIIAKSNISLHHLNDLLQDCSISSVCITLIPCFSYTLSREYRVVRSWYSRLLFTSEDRLCANLRVQEQSTNMTSQCQCLAFAWLHRSVVMTSQC